MPAKKPAKKMTTKQMKKTKGGKALDVGVSGKKPPVITIL